MFRFPDPSPVLPALNGFGVRKKLVTASSVYMAVTSRETTVLTQGFPLWEFDLTYEALRTQTENIDPYNQYKNLTDYEKIAAVFLACRGQYGRFYFSDPSDCSRVGQPIGNATGIGSKLRLVRTISSGALAFTEPVGGIDLSVLPVLKVSGSETPDGWSVLSDLQTIEFTDDIWGVVTMDFYYFYYCRFIDDVQNFEEFMHNLHALQSLKFRSTKDRESNSPDPHFLNP